MASMYILDGQTPVECLDIIEWGTWFEGADAIRKVAQDTIGPYTVSTVFLGVDHNFGLSGPLLLFETMVFGRGDVSWGFERYPTWSEAKAGHAVIVERAQAWAEVA